MPYLHVKCGIRWRARTGGEERPPAEATLAVSPLAELVPQTTAVPVPHDATTAPTPPPAPLPMATDSRSVTVSDDVRDPFSNTTIGDERAQRVSRQRVRATQQELAMLELELKMAERRKELARVVRETDAITHPSRPATPAPLPPIPRVQVVSISSTAALIQQHGWRQIVHRGARLNGWTLTQLAPTGITLRRAQRQAFLPLSFGPRIGGTR